MYFVVVITWLFTVVICGYRCFTIVMYDCCSWLPWLCSCLPWRCITVRHGFHAYVVVWHGNVWLLLVVTMATWLFYHGDVCMVLVVAWLFTKCCMSLVCCHVVISPWWCMHVARGYVVVSSQWCKSVAMRDTTPALNRTRELCLYFIRFLSGVVVVYWETSNLVKRYCYRSQRTLGKSGPCELREGIMM